RERQQALAELSTQVDAVLVVGGKNSENTKRLYKTAIGFGLPSWHIETASELTPEMMRYNRIGITAGASTPDFIVDEIQEMLVRMAQSE
ncbi:MAG TPA: 4-hydroxy-3-methylbut-2-enyl diphosphate reductase, partial [Rectinema sp.]|nr:4-hydroxy-3-methylbut-2-enyl diphosphate reductase [Rectinema sp.]